MPASIFELTAGTAVMNRQLRENVLLAATDAATVLTAPQSVESIITMTPTAGRAVTTAAATAIIAEIGSTYEVGTTFFVRIVNLAGATHAITFTAGSGVTITGSATVAAATSATFMGYIASSSTVTYYRV
jgi:hypothetical protein